MAGALSATTLILAFWGLPIALGELGWIVGILTRIPAAIGSFKFLLMASNLFIVVFKRSDKLFKVSPLVSYEGINSEVNSLSSRNRSLAWDRYEFRTICRKKEPGISSF